MSSTISERLNISNEILELKFGKSFTNSTNSNSKFISNKNAFNNNTTNESYHSIRYDFKPVSVDTSQTATIEFNEKNKVTVTAPNVESSGTPFTVFQGSRKPHLKECVLVIDHETGDFTLERLTNNIVVKRTRAEGSSKSKILNQQRPITPACSSQKSVSPKLQNQANSNKSSPNTNNSVPSSSYRNTKESKKDQPSTTMNSMPIFNATTLNANNTNLNITKSTFTNNDYNKIGVLSSSSSSSSSDEDDSSSSSQSSSSEDEQSFDKNKINVVENTNNKPISTMDFSSSSSSEIDSDDEKLNCLNNNLLNSLNNSLSNVGIGNSNSNQFNNNQFNNNGVVGFSMPKLSVLNDDLQLSESGSDSE